FQYKVPSDELAALKRLDTTNPEAYRLYLTARYYFSQYTGDSLQRAIDLYQQAITLDDRYALAYAGIGESYMVLGESTISAMLPDEAYRHAIEPTQKALELDPDLANAHSVLGNIQAKHTWDIPGSERSYSIQTMRMFMICLPGPLSGKVALKTPTRNFAGRPSSTHHRL